MIYLDSSVALAHLLGEDRAPPETLWRESLTASRLLEYEVWNRINVHGLAQSHQDDVTALLARVALIELVPSVLARAKDPFPIQVRTLDAMHLAALEFARDRVETIALATYDKRLAAGAQALGVTLFDLQS